jgi:hypothetical protein
VFVGNTTDRTGQDRCDLVSMLDVGLCLVRLFNSKGTARTEYAFKSAFWIWPQLREDDPLNLSISISGGRESNNDSPSNGE